MSPTANELSILLVTHYYADHQGGIETAALELASRLAQKGFKIVWAASAPAPRLPSGIAPLPMRACNLAERRIGFPYPIWGPASLARLWSAVHHADVVHLHDSLYFGNALAYGAARSMRKPVIVTQHVGDVPYRSPLLRMLLETANHTVARTVLGGCDRVVFTGQRVRDYFSKFVRFARPALLCPTGVDDQRFSPVVEPNRERIRQELGMTAQRPALLFVGRFVEKKGLDLLRTAAERFQACDWFFAGWGPLDPRKWALPNVRVIGRLSQEHLAGYYRAADLLVLPSQGEGFPLVVQEAMACGTTALITRETARGCPEVEGVALLCDPTVDDFAHAIYELLPSLAELNRHRRRIAAFANRHWNAERCAANYVALLARTARPNGHRSAPLLK